MAYTAPQIGTILLKADRTMYKIGQIAYENMFAEDNEALDYERDIIFIYKKAVEYADDLFLGTEKLDKVVERLAAKISAYDYGELNPIYADAALLNISTIVAGAALNDLTDVTITNVQDNQLLRYNSVTGQWINVGPGSAVRNSQAFTATAGQTVFTTSFPFDAGLFDLYLNGVKLNSSSYTTFGEYQITLNDACLVGDIVDVVIFDPNTSILPSINSLDDLVDVSLGALVNNQVLYYNSATGLWQNGTVSGGAWGTITGTLSNQTDLQSALDAKVPYTGATTNVNLGEYEIKAGQVTLDTSPTGTAAVGTTRWNDTLGSSETTLKGGNVILKNGVDLVARVVNKVSPNTTLTKAAYQAVRVSGAQGQRLAVSLAQANNDNNSADTIGLVTETIATNQEGFIITVGQLENINTSGSLQGETWADGDVLYLSPTTAGALTNVKPNATIGHIVVIGYVEYAHANNGKIYVKVMNGWELGELHDVYVPTPSNNDVLTYETSSGLWKNKSVGTALGYTPANAATTLTINGVTYDLSANRSWTVAGGISGSGASGQVAYWTGTSAQSGSNNLFWDNANGRLGIGTNAPSLPLHVVGNSYFNGDIGVGTTNLTGYNFVVARNISGAANSFAISSFGEVQSGVTNANYFITFARTASGIYTLSTLRHYYANQGTFGVNSVVTNQVGFSVESTLTGATNNYGFRGQIPSGSNRWNLYMDGTAANYMAGNVLLGSTTDNGQRLQVQGTTLLNGNVTFSSATGMTWDATNSRLGIGTNAPARALSVTSATNGNAVRIEVPASNLGVYDFYLGNAADSNYIRYNPFVLEFNRNGATSTIRTSGSSNDLLLQSSRNLQLAINAGTIAAQLYSTGNLVLQNGGTFTDSGERLQVTGDTLLKGSGATGGTFGLKVQNSNGVNILRTRNDGPVFIEAVNNVATLYMSSNGDSRIEKSTSGTNGMFFYGPATAHHTVSISSFNADNYSNGALSSLRLIGNFVSASGSTAFSYMLLNGTINQTGTSTSIVRGLYVNPTLTAAADFRAIETTNGKVIFGNLPTSSAGLPTGAIWNNGGVINIV